MARVSEVRSQVEPEIARSFVRRHARVVAASAVVAALVIVYFAYHGARAIFHRRDLSAAAAALHADWPAFPETMLIHARRNEDHEIDREEVSYGPDRFSFRWQILLILDIDRIPNVRPDEIGDFYYQEVLRRGFAFERRDSPDYDSGTEPEVMPIRPGEWVDTAASGGPRGRKRTYVSGSGVLTIQTRFYELDNSYRPVPLDDLLPADRYSKRDVKGRRVAFVHIQLFDSGFTDGDFPLPEDYFVRPPAHVRGKPTATAPVATPPSATAPKAS